MTEHGLMDTTIPSYRAFQSKGTITTVQNIGDPEDEGGTHLLTPEGHILFIIALVVGIILYFLVKKGQDKERVRRDIQLSSMLNSGDWSLFSYDEMSQMRCSWGYYIRLGANPDSMRAMIKMLDLYDLEVARNRLKSLEEKSRKASDSK